MNYTVGSLLAFLVGLNMSGSLPLGVPPLPEDRALISAAPENCLFYLSSYGTAQADADGGNHVERMLAEPEVKKFVSAIWEQIGAAARRGDPSASQMLAVAEIALTRPASVFVSKLKVRLQDDGPPDVDMNAGLIVNAGDAAARLNQILRTLEKRIPVEEVEEVTVGGVKLRQLPLPEGRPPVQWGFHREYLIVAVGQGTAQRIIASLKAPRDPPTWLATLHKRLPVERPSVVQYINLQGVAATVRETLGPRAAMVDHVLGVLGLDNVESLSSVTGLGKTDLESKTLLAVNGKPRGLLALAADTPLAARDLAHIPRDADWAYAERFDAAKTYTAVIDTIGKFSPQVGELVEGQVARVEEQFGIRIQADLLQPLGDVWTMHNAPSQGGFLFTGACATVSVRDSARLAKTQQKILDLVREIARGDDNPVRRSSFGDRAVYHLELDGVPFAPAWCLTDKHFVVAAYPQVIKAHLTRGQDAASVASVAEVADALGRRPIALAYQNTPQLARTFYPWLQMMAPVIFQQLQKGGVDLDSSILPSARAIYPHLHSSVTAVRRTDAGFVMTSRQSTPGSFGGLSSAPMVVALLLPAVQAAREAARRTASMNNLRQIAIGMHNFHDVHNHLPSPANYDKNGKPLLSWRVHLLPYMEGQGLYERFRLDEPWDSPHNKQLIKLMPSVYQVPGWYQDDGKTAYVAVSGDKTLFPKGKADPRNPKHPRGITFGQVTDGLSNTIMVVELGLNAEGVFRDHSVIWTKPDDWQFNPKQVTAKLYGRRPNGFLAARGDGSVFFVPKTAAEKTLRAMFTRNGGEPFEEP